MRNEVGEGEIWKDIWGSGQGIGSIKSDPSVQDLVNELTEQYEQAYEEMQKKKTG
jgi:nitronate monooxygenase